MRRESVLVSILAVVLVGWVAFGRGGGTAAQDGTPVPPGTVTVEATAPPPVVEETTPAETTGAHPLVGVWLLDTDADDPENAPEVVAFTADGVYVSADAEGFPSLGVWAATGEQTGTLTIVSTSTDDDGGFGGTFTIRATVEVDASGDAFTAEYTAEFVQADDTSEGEFGPGTATATRITAEEPGEPVGPLSVLFEGFEGTAVP